MSDISKKVFISYRRASGFYEAYSVFKELRAHGYDVFWDIESIPSGEFETIILNQIAARPHFILILTPGTLDRTVEEGDWLRREVGLAIDLERNIIPVCMKDFSIEDGESYYSGTLKKIPNYNALTIPDAFFEEGIKRLRERFLQQSISVEVQPTPDDERIIVDEKIRKAVEVDEGPDLVLQLTPSPNPAVVGAEITWTVAAHNKGNDPANIINIVHGQNVLVENTELLPGQTGQSRFSKTYFEIGEHTENICLLAPPIYLEVDSTVMVQEPAKLSLVLTPKPKSVEPDQQVTWTVDLVNDGGADLHHVMVKRGRTLVAVPFHLPVGKQRSRTFNEIYRNVGESTEEIIVTGMTRSGDLLQCQIDAAVKVIYPDLITLTKPLKMELIRIPEGKFLLGSDEETDKRAYSDEQPHCRLNLPEYFIGKTSVTNAQYSVFVDANGYSTPSHWEDGQVPLGKQDHPVVNVSFRDTLVFCEWLSEESGLDVSLPSEAEWEKAARGTEGLIFPWGDRGDKRKSNTKESEIGDTTPVNKYLPGGNSPYGCLDMSGNIWEWTRSIKSEYPYVVNDGREDLDAPDHMPRVMRGGSWHYDRRRARCASRGWSYPLKKGISGGFRICVAPRRD